VKWTLEVVVVPVSDVERAKAFYADRVGFVVDHDQKHGDMRVLQLTPPGSGCSIVLGTGTGVGESVPGSLKGLQLVVPDIDAARAELIGRGVEVSEIKRFDDRDGGAFIYFDDPDGNSWAVQEIRARA
jgi:predicted enzyme related to lactoylglutathione lyase